MRGKKEEKKRKEERIRIQANLIEKTADEFQVFEVGVKGDADSMLGDEDTNDHGQVGFHQSPNKSRGGFLDISDLVEASSLNSE